MTTTTTLIALHGFTQNGALLREALAPFEQRLGAALRFEYPDGPVACSDASVERLQRLVGGEPWPAPHRAWFDATDDGREYRGLELTRAQIGERVQRARADGRVGLLGFSQGAIATACLSALSAHGQFPPIDFAVLVAGRPPRADAIAPLLARPIAIPSLHVWGDRDALAARTGQPLADCFDPNGREIAIWPGPHVVPTRGNAADAIADFLARQASSHDGPSPR